MALKSSENSPKSESNDNKEKERRKEITAQVIKKKIKIKKKIAKQKVGTTLLYVSPSSSSPIISQAGNTSELLSIVGRPLMSSAMVTYYQPNFCPLTVAEWNPLLTTVQTASPIYTVPFQPLPILMTPSQIIPATLCPFTCTAMTPPVLPSVISHPATDVPTESTYIYEPAYSGQLVANTTPVSDDLYYTVPENMIICKATQKDLDTDPLEEYLSLPKDLFPTPRMLSIDPNPVIDEFCKIKNVHHNAPWILDLEFGIPRTPVTRPIPTYNVKFNSINCKNTPDAIHPGFESCSQDFKKVLLFYYDCVISSWYRGYMALNCDNSVENFQSWLLLPMQVLGMCWP